MEIETGIDDFINKYNIQEVLFNSFRNLVNNNSIGDLDIENKDIFIHAENINFKITALNHFKFSTLILRNEKIIGSYSLVFTREGNLVDELFIID
ncbi:hypothetical protein [Pedobacter paludis]|uniref:Uncharacterized protein n=1 Tax=Pedobacter paludis TaxID=2203212 RepID=A0A317EYC5_9SPHI|nr:hypothetical protein [Pedobacter paludis]PWS31980.1 hypothetical protein DF947_09325 [Pedobacter paludis]